MIEVSVNRLEEVDGEAYSSTIGILKIDDTDPSSTPEVLQPLDGVTLAVLLKVLNDIQAAVVAAQEAWA